MSTGTTKRRRKKKTRSKSSSWGSSVERKVEVEEEECRRAHTVGLTRRLRKRERKECKSHRKPNGTAEEKRGCCCSFVSLIDLGPFYSLSFLDNKSEWRSLRRLIRTVCKFIQYLQEEEEERKKKGWRGGSRTSRTLFPTSSSAPP